VPEQLVLTQLAGSDRVPYPVVRVQVARIRRRDFRTGSLLCRWLQPTAVRGYDCKFGGSNSSM
jgi:hypothetical protein